MSLYFTDKKKHWPPPKAVQYLLAGIVLVSAIAILVGWLLFRFVYSEEVEQKPDTKPTPTSSTQIPNDLPDPAYCLFIINDMNFERFALVKFAPVENTVTVHAISSSLPISESETLAQMYRRTKEIHVTNALANHFRLPLKHYISLSISEFEALIAAWSGTLTIAPTEEISYVDENGVTVRIPAESSTIPPKKVTALLRYTQWKSEQSKTQLSAELAAAMLRYILSPHRDLNKCYFEIADHTNILIQHFNSFYKGLSHLATQDAIIQQKNLSVQ